MKNDDPKINVDICDLDMTLKLPNYVTYLLPLRYVKCNPLVLY